MNKPEVLIIDDEDQILRLLEITLKSNDFKVSSASTAKEGLIKASNHPPDLILLDLGLPDESGHTVLAKLKRWYANPVIILSVRSSESDIVQALDNGAHDYIIKPFRTGELLARIRSSLRKKNSEDGNPVFRSEDLMIDTGKRIVFKNNQVIKLTTTEYKLLLLFVMNAGKVLTHHFVLREIWGPGFIEESQYLRVFIAQLRKKIEDDPNRPSHILTESGVGYRFILN